MHSFFIFVGRILISSLFFTATYWHITHWDTALAKMVNSGVQHPAAVLISSTLLMLLGAISLLLGYLTRLGSLLLIIEVAVSAVLLNNFWELYGEERQLVLLLFLTRMAICGGLFVLLGMGPGSISVDARILRKKGV